MIERPSGPTKPGPARMTALGSTIDCAKYSAGWWAPMPVSSGPTSPAPPVFGKSDFTAWHLLHSSLAKSSRPVFGSPGGSVNFQPRGTPPARCRSSMVIGVGGFAAVLGFGVWAGARATRPRTMPSAGARRGTTTIINPASAQLELDGQLHPHRDRLRAAACGLESPATHRVGGGPVEIGMPGRLLHDDLSHASVGLDEHAEHRGALVSGGRAT